MKKIPALLLAGALLAAPAGFAQPGLSTPPTDASLAALAQGHEQIFRNITGDAPISVVLQRGDKQFVISGVTQVRAIGSALEITVNNNRKYSVGPTDILFITNDTFGLK